MDEKAAQESSVLDNEIIEQLLTLGDRAFLMSLVGSFLDAQVGGLTSISQAINHADPKALQRSAHHLKSSCASIGAKRAAAICQAIELKGRCGQSEALNDLSMLQAELELVKGALRSLIQEGELS